MATQITDLTKPNKGIKDLNKVQTSNYAINTKESDQQAKENFIAKTMEAIGMRYDYNQKAFVFKNDFIDVFADWNLLQMSEGEIVKLAEWLGNEIEVAKINQFNFDNISGRTKSKLKKGKR